MTDATKPDWHRGHEWKCEGWDFKGGQQAGVGPRRYNCLTCKLVTKWTRESTFRFLGKQPMCEGPKRGKEAVEA